MLKSTEFKNIKIDNNWYICIINDSTTASCRQLLLRNIKVILIFFGFRVLVVGFFGYFLCFDWIFWLILTFLPLVLVLSCK